MSRSNKAGVAQSNAAPNAENTTSATSNQDSIAQKPNTTNASTKDEVEEVREKVHGLNLEEPQQNSNKETSYEWLKNQTWSDSQASEWLTKKFVNRISSSKNYTDDKWNEWKSGKYTICLGKIFRHLDRFIETVAEKSNAFSELEKVVHKLRDFPDVNAGVVLNDLKNDPSLPLNRDIIDKNKVQTPKQVKRKKGRYTAKSLPSTTSSNDYTNKHLFVDGYMLEVSVPNFKKEFLEMSGFTSDKSTNLTRRWIFIPSYTRANYGLFDWSIAGIDEETTIRIIVVRPSQFKEYKKHCGNHLPIISLPDNQIGVGYARYWIQKIATSLKLEYIWMIDDDVKQFFEAHPADKDAKKKSYVPYRRRRFEEVFTKFESIVKENEDSKLAAISPAVHRGKNKAQNPFVRKPPRAAVFLNLKLINPKKVTYRPQLSFFEDMLFGKECEEKGLKVIIWNQIRLYNMSNSWRKKKRGREEKQEQEENQEQEDEEDEDEEDEEDEEEDEEEEGEEEGTTKTTLNHKSCNRTFEV